LQDNLTQLGDTVVILSFLTFFIVYVPKLWETLISGLLVSSILTIVPKKIFSVPRPAAVLDNDSFLIVGEKLVGHNCLPSGHSITVFTTLTILMFALMPEKPKLKIVWCGSLVLVGLTIVIMRVGVGAHYPVDVLAGSILGYISAIAGIFITKKSRIWSWIRNTRFYPVFVVLFLICCFTLLVKIVRYNLVVFYVSLIFLILSLYIISAIYVKKHIKK
jgi:membrane-associated phospholipid phosphatase